MTITNNGGRNGEKKTGRETKGTFQANSSARLSGGTSPSSKDTGRDGGYSVEGTGEEGFKGIHGKAEEKEKVR